MSCLLLAGCGTAMDALDREQPSNEPVLQITGDGVGPLGGETLANEAAIRSALPGFDVGTLLIGLETENRPALVVYKSTLGSQVQVLQIIAGPNGKVLEIHGVSHRIIGPSGERPGMTLAQAGVDASACRRGKALWSTMVVCSARSSANVKLTFSISPGSDQTAGLPPRDVLEKAELQRVIWTAKR